VSNHSVETIVGRMRRDAFSVMLGPSTPLARCLLEFGFDVLCGVALAAVLVAVNFDWGGLIGPAVIGLFVFRYFRNRKKRLIASFAKKVGKFREVRLVTARDDRVTVVVDKAPAKVYIRITALIEELNRSLFVGRDITAEVKSEVPEAEAQAMLRQVGVVYAREEALAAPSPKARKG